MLLSCQTSEKHLCRVELLQEGKGSQRIGSGGGRQPGCGSEVPLRPLLNLRATSCHETIDRPPSPCTLPAPASFLARTAPRASLPASEFHVRSQSDEGTCAKSTLTFCACVVVAPISPLHSCLTMQGYYRYLIAMKKGLLGFTYSNFWTSGHCASTSRNWPLMAALAWLVRRVCTSFALQQPRMQPDVSCRVPMPLVSTPEAAALRAWCAWHSLGLLNLGHAGCEPPCMQEKLAELVREETFVKILRAPEESACGRKEGAGV